VKINKRKKKLTFLFQKQDLGYCCQPFPFFPLSIELIQSLQLVGWWEGSWIWLWDGAKASPYIYIYMVGSLGSLVLQEKEGLWWSKYVFRFRFVQDVSRVKTSQYVSETYKLSGFFIELWLKRQSSLLPRHPFSFCTRRIGTKEDVSERYKLRGNHNINPKSDMGR
jgi:hypothetical protein